MALRRANHAAEDTLLVQSRLSEELRGADTGALTDWIEKLTDGSSAPTAASSLKTILQYVRNIRKYPQDQLFRYVCMYDMSFQTCISAVPGALECMQAAGFTSTFEATDRTPYLVMPHTNVVVLEQIERLLVKQLNKLGANTGVHHGSTRHHAAHLVNDAAKRMKELKESNSSGGYPIHMPHHPHGQQVLVIRQNQNMPVLLVPPQSQPAPMPPQMAFMQALNQSFHLQRQRMAENEIRNSYNLQVDPNIDEAEAINRTTDKMIVARSNSELFQKLKDRLAADLAAHIGEMFNRTTSPSNSTSPASDQLPSGLPTPQNFQQFLPFILSGAGGGSPGAGGPSSAEETPDDLDAIKKRLGKLQLPTEVAEAVGKEVRKLQKMGPFHNSEYSTIMTWLEWIADLPWSVHTTDCMDINKARAQLEVDHRGLDKVKKRMLQFLAVAKLRGDNKGPILCLHGPPGVGKTSLGQSIAKALNRKFHRISLGGVHSESEIRGHRRTYVGAMPGMLIDGLKKCGSANPLMMLDEIDKLGRNSFHGDPTSALLEVLDPEQNGAFKDHFINHPFNLSRTMFIATANDQSHIPHPLFDRMEVLTMAGYTVPEKVAIGRTHLLKKQLKENGINAEHLRMSDRVLELIATTYSHEAGVRQMEREIATVCRQVASRLVEWQSEQEVEAAPNHTALNATAQAADGLPANSTAVLKAAPTDTLASNTTQQGLAAHATANFTQVVVDSESLHEFLGPPKHFNDAAERLTKPGIAMGLAWTSAGGDLLFIEATRMGGKGLLMLTGKLGDVMQESARTSLSWIRSHAVELNLTNSTTNNFLEASDMHLHFPAGAVPKDGPSAGVTITTALVSLLTGRNVRSDTAMTGEVSLRGLVLPVGGIKDKVLAAHRAGIQRVILPAKNERDLHELPANVKEEMEFIFVSEIFQVLTHAIHGLNISGVDISPPSISPRNISTGAAAAIVAEQSLSNCN